MLPYAVIRFGEGSLHKCEVMLKVRGTALTALLIALIALLTLLTITTNFTYKRCSKVRCTAPFFKKNACVSCVLLNRH